MLRPARPAPSRRELMRIAEQNTIDRAAMWMDSDIAEVQGRACNATLSGVVASQSAKERSISDLATAGAATEGAAAALPTLGAPPGSGPHGGLARSRTEMGKPGRF